jgi:arginyl-tRNA synthetase
VLREKLRADLEQAVEKAMASGDLPRLDIPPIAIDTPPDPKFGDYATNLAMLLAAEAKMAPKDVAGAISRHLESDLVEKTQTAGPGFLNLFVQKDQIGMAAAEILAQAEDYGRSDSGQGKRVQVEFVSVNPNGPITVASGWGGAIGDVLASLLTWAGHSVEREYYVNDAVGSTQMYLFCESVISRYMQAFGREYTFPENGYPGQYVTDLALEIKSDYGDRFVEMDPDERHREITEIAIERMVDSQRRDLEAFGIRYDVWFSERSLFDSGAVDRALATLEERGYAYDSEGAKWLRTTEFGDDQDRPIVRRTGEPTYLLGDLAYHVDKLKRGFDLVLDVWGPDHQGHVRPTMAGIEAVGLDPKRIEILIHSNVRLKRGGEVVTMGKRTGDIIALSEVVGEVGKDAARFMYLTRSADAPLDFDLDLAKAQSDENPVYYVQYAHARICSILRTAQERGAPLPTVEDADLSILTDDAEQKLIKRLDDFPAEVRDAAGAREPHRMTRYAMGLATDFHAFYTVCRVLGDDPERTKARLLLVEATRTVLRNVLAILGVTAPERM